MNKNYLIAIVAVLVLGGGVYYFSTKSSPVAGTPSPATQPVANQPSAQQNSAPSAPAKTTAPKSAAKTSVVVMQPTITAVSMGTVLSASGAIAKAVTTFSPTTPKLYAVLSLKNAVARTQLSYIRYYNGKYVDSKVSHPSVDGVPYFHFEWTLTAGKTLKAGNYTLVFYIDGKKAQSVSYIVK